MVWYRANSSIAIEEVNVVSETSKFVTVSYVGYEKHVRHAKDSEGDWFRPTREEAKQCLIEYFQKRIEEARERVAYEEKHLSRVKNL